MSDEASRSSMNGSPIVDMVNGITNNLTNELLRVRPDYQSRRRGELAGEIRSDLLTMLRARIPSLYSEYKREAAAFTDSQSAVSMQKGVTQHENNSTSGTEGSRSEVVSPVPRLGT